jgi:hypothetical protein
MSFYYQVMCGDVVSYIYIVTAFKIKHLSKSQHTTSNYHKRAIPTNAHTTPNIQFLFPLSTQPNNTTTFTLSPTQCCFAHANTCTQTKDNCHKMRQQGDKQQFPARIALQLCSLVLLTSRSNLSYIASFYNNGLNNPKFWLI